MALTLNTITCSAFVDELSKTADVIYRDGKNARLLSGGLYVGTSKDHEKKHRIVANLIGEHGSLQKAKQKYKEMYPNDYIGAAFNFKEKPRRGGFLGIGGTEKSLYDRQVKSWEERSKSPRIFVRVGKPGGASQNSFYKEVRRGYYDNELKNAPIPEKDKTVYR